MEVKTSTYVPESNVETYVYDCSVNWLMITPPLGEVISIKGNALHCQNRICSLILRLSNGDKHFAYFTQERKVLLYIRK